MATLKIPEGFEAWMREAALRELADDARGLDGESQETVRTLRREAFNARHGLAEAKPLEWQLADIIAWMRDAEEKTRVVRQVCEQREEIEGSPEALAYLLDSLWRRVLRDELEDQDGPFAATANKALWPVIEALNWATGEVERLEPEWRAEVEAKRSEASV